MISLDQVLLLEEKVESAVAKIQQLEAENDALRNKCSELTNALSVKTEQLNAFESDQKKIETGIIKAIDRLNSIENSVLKAAGQSAVKEAPAQALPPTPPVPPVPPTPPVKPAPAAAPAQAAPVVEEPAAVEPEPEETIEPVEVTETPNFDSMEPVEEQLFEDAAEIEEQEYSEPSDESEAEDPESRDELGFDIF